MGQGFRSFGATDMGEMEEAAGSGEQG
jgi:hypothetical protein